MAMIEASGVTTIKAAMVAHAAELAAEVWGDKRARQPAADAPWSILQVIRGSDAHAIEALKELGIATYQPQYRVLKPVPAKRLSRGQRTAGYRPMRPALVPLLPRYLFARLDLGALDWRLVTERSGVGGLVCAGGLPVLARQADIDRLMGREVDGAIPPETPLRMVFAEGERVRVAGQAFGNYLNATVEKTLDLPIESVDAGTRIRLAIDMFGRSTAVDVPVSQVEKL